MREPTPALRVLSDGREAAFQRLREENASLHRALHLMHEVGALVNQTLDLRSTLHAVLTGVTAGVGLGMNRALLFMSDERARTELRCVAAVGPQSRDEADLIWKSIEARGLDLAALHGATEHAQAGGLGASMGGLRLDVRQQTPIGLALRERRLVTREGADDLSSLLDLKTCLAAPLRTGQRSHGVLYADNLFTGRIPDAATELVFSMIADHAARAIENAQRYERVAHEARTDALTGLGHHGALMQALEHALLQPGRRECVGLAMIDIDYFKRVNDTLGHLAGDALLAELAARLRECCRTDEVPYRYGGEEFAVVLHGVSRTDLLYVGERLRRSVCDKLFRVSEGRDLAVTCSVGLAAFPDVPAQARSAQALIQVSDSALLRAKRNGRNRIELACAPH